MTNHNTESSRERSVRVNLPVFPNSPHARERLGRLEASEMPPRMVFGAAHRGAHSLPTALVPAGIGGLSLVALSSAHGGGWRRGVAGVMTSTADVGHPPGPPFAIATPPAIPGEMCGVFSKLSLAGCFL